MVDEDTRRQGMKQISEFTDQASGLLLQAQTIADATGNTFTFSVGERLMTYEPVGPEFQSSNCYGEDTGGWKSSSDYC